MSATDQRTVTRQQILQRIHSDTKFVLATHENLDGDALGSLVAMQGLLTMMGKDSQMFIAESEFPLPHEYRLFALDGLIKTAPEDVNERTVVFLDCGNIDRNSAQVLRSGAHLLNIDHHHDNTLFGTVNHVVAAASCTAEIVWELMGELSLRPTAQIAKALYVGLITDTGRFMYENTGPRAHQMAAELITAGVDVQAIYRELYEEMPFAKIALLALALSRVERLNNGELTMASLSAEDFQRVEAQDSYSEGIIDHLRAIQGTKVAALVRELTAPERAGQRKVSLRATDNDVDVSAIARAQGGGGHRRAAGFSTRLALPELTAFLQREIDTQLRPAANDRVAPTLA